MQRKQALWPACRVGIAISGGVDSFVLLKVMQLRQAITPFKFEIMALHVNAGFDREDHAGLSAWLAREGISGHIEVGNFGPDAHTEVNRSNSPCFYCAYKRRSRLFDLCRQYRLSHLALGHNAEDMLSSFILNFFRNGRVQALNSSAAFFNGQLQLIRPLMLVEKKYILQAARQWKLPVWRNACPVSGRTGRDQALELVSHIEEKLQGSRKSMLNALMRMELGETDMLKAGDCNK